MRTNQIAITLAVVMCSASVAGIAARPSVKAADRGSTITLEDAVPKQFGEWIELPNRSVQVVNPQTKELLDKLYSQILTRTYVNSDGYRIMLSLAYGDDQRGGLQAHRPEVCYPAQGFKLGSRSKTVALPTPYGAIDVRRLTTSLGSRQRAGDLLAHRRRPGDPNTFDKRMAEIRLGLHRADSRRAAVSRLVDRRRPGPGVRDATEVRGRHDVGRSGNVAQSSSGLAPTPAKRRAANAPQASRGAPLAAVEQPRQQRIEGEEDSQRHQHQHDAGGAVQETLPRLVAEVIGDQHQGDHAHDVGDEGDRKDADQHQRVVQAARSRHHVRGDGKLGWGRTRRRVDAQAERRVDTEPSLHAA